MCPYNAIEFLRIARSATSLPALCKGCGTCVAACPANEQIMAQIEGILLTPYPWQREAELEPVVRSEQ
jgi:heterodisulfide reductase subunit A2